MPRSTARHWRLSLMILNLWLSDKSWLNAVDGKHIYHMRQGESWVTFFPVCIWTHQNNQSCHQEADGSVVAVCKILFSNLKAVFNCNALASLMPIKPVTLNWTKYGMILLLSSARAARLLCKVGYKPTVVRDNALTAMQRSVCRGYQEMMHHGTWRGAVENSKSTVILKLQRW